MIAGGLEIGCKRSVAAPQHRTLTAIHILQPPRCDDPTPFARAVSPHLSLTPPARFYSMQIRHRKLCVPPISIIHDAVLNGFLSGPGVHKVRERAAHHGRKSPVTLKVGAPKPVEGEPGGG